MNLTGRIPIPWEQRWRRFRHGTLPLLGFAICTLATFWLWNRQGSIPNAVAEVEAIRVMVTAAADGRLKALPSPHDQWTLYDEVEPDQVVAQIDEEPLRATLATLTEEQLRLRKDLDAATAKLNVEERDRGRSYLADAARMQSDAARMQYDLEQRHLLVLERKLLIETDRLEAERLKVKVDCLKRAYDKKVIAEMELNDARMQHQEVAKRLEENEKLLGQDASGALRPGTLLYDQKEAEERWRSFSERAKNFPDMADDKEVQDRIKVELAPIQAAEKVQEARIKETNLLISKLAVRAPQAASRGSTGPGGWRICAIHRRPGENVRAGEPIVTLAAEGANYIVAYVRQEQRLTPQADMDVDVRVRMPSAQPVSTKIEQIGPQVEPIPVHLCRDPKVQEWGLPVRIALPPGFSVRPGELLDVKFKPAAKDNG